MIEGRWREEAPAAPAARRRWWGNSRRFGGFAASSRVDAEDDDGSAVVDDDFAFRARRWCGNNRRRGVGATFNDFSTGTVDEAVPCGLAESPLDVLGVTFVAVTSRVGTDSLCERFVVRELASVTAVALLLLPPVELGLDDGEEAEVEVAGTAERGRAGRRFALLRADEGVDDEETGATRNTCRKGMPHGTCGKTR